MSAGDGEWWGEEARANEVAAHPCGHGYRVPGLVASGTNFAFSGYVAVRLEWFILL